MVKTPPMDPRILFRNKSLGTLNKGYSQWLKGKPHARNLRPHSLCNIKCNDAVAVMWSGWATQQILNEIQETQKFSLVHHDQNRTIKFQKP